jgi:inositol hexakisphosphate/diphosphoinositol-pentakisphosphate kinase
MDPLSRTQSKESAQSVKSSSSTQLLSNSYALSSASSGSRKGRSADPETTNGNVERADISIARQIPQRALSHLNTGTASDTALLSSDKPANPAQVSSIAERTAGTVTNEAFNAGATPTLEGITLPKPLPIVLDLPPRSPAFYSKSSKYGVRS